MACDNSSFPMRNDFLSGYLWAHIRDTLECRSSSRRGPRGCRGVYVCDCGTCVNRSGAEDSEAVPWPRDQDQRNYNVDK